MKKYWIWLCLKSVIATLAVFAIEYAIWEMFGIEKVCRAISFYLTAILIVIGVLLWEKRKK